ncbi:MAG: hypothetical protein FJ098_00740 [Deltaproteobacteria bacterium]|nr:hypothetical protein [Deltaproteobacteria bacterium]
MAARDTNHLRENCVWPLQRGGAGWTRASLAWRLDAGLKRLVEVPKGALLVDPRFGTIYEECRTQGISQSRADQLQADIEGGARAYLPEVSVQSVEADMSYRPLESETLRVDIHWSPQVSLGTGDAVSATRVTDVSR